jgi:hypothetical protein
MEGRRNSHGGVEAQSGNMEGLQNSVHHFNGEEDSDPRQSEKRDPDHHWFKGLPATGMTRPSRSPNMAVVNTPMYCRMIS